MFVRACLLLLFFSSSRIGSKDFSEKFHQIPIEDRALIDSFFKILMLQEDGAYVLFGDKPVVYTAYFDFSEEEVYSNFGRKFWLVNKQLRQGWHAWQKYAHQFPSTRFLLKGRRSSDDRTEIVLIDKARFQCMFEEHVDDFQSILGKNVTASSLLRRYENNDLPLFDLLQQHHALLGILLGYGKRNSWLFHFRDRVYENCHHFTLVVNPHPSSGFKSTKEERNYYRSKLMGSFLEKNHRKPYKFLYLPMFIVNPQSQETKDLREKYLQQREQIHDIYSHGDFLEITLKQFCS